LKIIGHGNPDNNLESLCILRLFLHLLNITNGKIKVGKMGEALACMADVRKSLKKL
jgi:hypothetical protein